MRLSTAWRYRKSTTTTKLWNAEKMPKMEKRLYVRVSASRNHGVSRWPDADEGRKRHCCTRSQQRQPSWIWTWTKKENNVICGDLSALLEVLIFSRIWNAFNIKLVENLRIQPNWRRMDSLGQHKKSSQQNWAELKHRLTIMRAIQLI